MSGINNLVGIKLRLKLLKSINLSNNLRTCEDITLEDRESVILQNADSKQPSPHISIVTINFNNIQELKKTFSSVISQTYQDLEYIVIDGGSQDGTVNFLEENSKVFKYWVSERDRGIYDAMNKGVKAAKGEWIVFMNAGDLFASEKTIEQIAPYLDRANDVVYGGFESITDDEYGYRTAQRQPANLSIIWHQIPTCHQSIFVRRELQAEYPFDTSLSWCADHDFLARLYQLNCKFKEVPIIVSKFDTSGGKVRDLLTYTRERWSIYRKYFDRNISQELFFINEYRGFWLQKNLNQRIRNILPKEWIIALRKLRKIY
jgi:glycosyltransferase involved in cell wall biosynthesis